MTASTSSTLRPTTAGTLVAGFPRGRFSASPGTRVLSFSRASSTISPADALRGPGPLGAREGTGDVAAGRIERSARPLPVAGAGLDQAAQRLVCGAAPRAVLDGHLIARQADRAVDVADGTGPASSRTPYPTAEQAGPQVLRAPVAAALSSPPPDPLPGLAAALRGLTHEAARFPQLIIIYDQIPDRRRGRGFATGIHLNEALEWSKRPGPPQSNLHPTASRTRYRPCPTPSTSPARQVWSPTEGLPLRSALLRATLAPPAPRGARSIGVHGGARQLTELPPVFLDRGSASAVPLPGDIADVHVRVEHIGTDDHSTGRLPTPRSRRSTRPTAWNPTTLAASAPTRTFARRARDGRLRWRRPDGPCSSPRTDVSLEERHASGAGPDETTRARATCEDPVPVRSWPRWSRRIPTRTTNGNWSWPPRGRS